jgi:hypothetical protein
MRSLKDVKQQPPQLIGYPVRVDDVNALGIFELKAALIIFGVRDSDHARLKVDKQLKLKAAMRK